MKLVKMSLAAAMLMGASAYALDDVKFNGQAKLWYQTTDSNTADLFDKAGASGQAALELGISGKGSETVGFNLELSAVDSLGLESNLVSNVPATTVKANGTATTVAERVSTQWWASQANLTIKAGNTTAVLGRQELDTPLCFTEKWNSVKNTFDAAVLVNGDIPNTTLVAAWVGKDNSAAGGSTVNWEGSFDTFAVDGAYAFGAVFAGIKDVTLQGWYYELQSLATAYWLQADGKVALGDNMALSYGAQYANIDVDGTALDGSAYALKVGFGISGIDMFVAYSDVDDNAFTMANTATGDKTKLYTGTSSIYADGAVVGAADSESFKLGVSGTAGSVKLAASYTNVSNDTTDAFDGDAWDISAATTVAGVGLKAIYTQETFGTNTDTDALRVIATLKF